MEPTIDQQTVTTGASVVAPPTVTTAASPVVTTTNIKWGAVFGGAVASLGIATMLYALGLALGLSWLDPNDPGSIRPSGIFSGIWLLVVSLIALFVGGYVAARGAGALTRGFGALHGLVMWGLSVVAGAWLMGNLASAVVSGGAAVGRVAASAVGEGMTPANQLRDLPQRMGVTSNDLLAPVNERLRSAGKQEVSPQQLESATRDVLRRSVREGRLDREMLTQAIVANTDLTRADATQIASDAETRFQAARTDVQRQLTSARQTALEAAEDSSKAFWALFGALLLGMLAAIGGAMVAGNRGKRLGSGRIFPDSAHQTAAYP